MLKPKSTRISTMKAVSCRSKSIARWARAFELSLSATEVAPKLTLHRAAQRAAPGQDRRARHHRAPSDDERPTGVALVSVACQRGGSLGDAQASTSVLPTLIPAWFTRSLWTQDSSA